MAEVGCAGILVADTFCGPMRALPVPGQLLAVDAMPTRVGGCAANVAIGLARQGVSADVVGCVGRDPAAEVPLTELRRHGVGCTQIVRDERLPTSTTVVLLVEGDDRRFIHCFGANAAFTIGHIRRDWIERLKVFYLGGLFVMPGIATGELAALLEFCRRAGVVTVVDVVVPHGFGQQRDLQALLPLIDWFLPNDDEARIFTGKAEPLDQLAALLAAGANTVVITCGRHGAVARWRCGAFAMPTLDPSGAGDAFDAGVIAGIVKGWEMPRLLRFAAALGASAVRAIGTTPGVFDAAEAQAFLDAQPNHVETWIGR